MKKLRSRVYWCKILSTGQETETVSSNKEEMIFSQPLKVCVLGDSAERPLLSSTTLSSWVLSSLPVITTYMLVGSPVPPPRSISPARPSLPEGRSMYPTAKWTQMSHGPLKFNRSKVNSSSFSSTWAPPVIPILVNGIIIHHDVQKPGSHPRHQIDHMEVHSPLFMEASETSSTQCLEQRHQLFRAVLAMELICHLSRLPPRFLWPFQILRDVVSLPQFPQPAPSSEECVLVNWTELFSAKQLKAIGSVTLNRMSRRGVWRAIWLEGSIRGLVLWHICIASTAFFSLCVCLGCPWRKGRSPAGAVWSCICRASTIFIQTLYDYWSIYRAGKLKAGANHPVGPLWAGDRFQTGGGRPGKPRETSWEVLRLGLVPALEIKRHRSVVPTGMNQANHFSQSLPAREWKMRSETKETFLTCLQPLSHQEKVQSFDRASRAQVTLSKNS